MAPRLRQAAAMAVESLGGSQILILPQTPNLFEQAFRRYQSRPDKNWSMTDCASFILMEQEGLTAALTHDRHFTQAGFKAMLR